MNLKMTDLKHCVESAGYTGVKTILSSGNVAFDAPKRLEAALARKISTQLKKNLGRSFPVTVRSTEHLSKLLASDPYKPHALQAEAKRVITFLWTRPTQRLSLPMELDGATILKVRGTEAFSAYVPSPRGPVFMKLIQSTFGTEQTTRTWETVRKCSAA